MGRPKGYRFSAEQKRMIGASVRRTLARPEVKAKMCAPRPGYSRQPTQRPTQERKEVIPAARKRPVMPRQIPEIPPVVPAKEAWGFYMFYEGRPSDKSLQRMDAIKPDTDLGILTALSNSYEVAPGKERHIRGPRQSEIFPTFWERGPHDPPPIKVGPKEKKR